MNQTAASRSICARFAAAARTYHDDAGVQRTIAEKLAASIPPLNEIDSILEIGCGTGLLTELLLRRFPGTLIHAVDIARPMIDQAKDRIGEHRVRWHAADARQFRPGRDFPLIVSSSALHWMTPVSETIRRLAGMLQPGGRLVSALMVKGTFEELHSAMEHLFADKTAKVSLPPAEKVLEALADAGLTIESNRQEVLRVRYDSAMGFFRSLNRQGVTGAVNDGCSLLNRSELRKLILYYGALGAPTKALGAPARACPGPDPGMDDQIFAAGLRLAAGSHAELPPPRYGVSGDHSTLISAGAPSAQATYRVLYVQAGREK